MAHNLKTVAVDKVGHGTLQYKEMKAQLVSCCIYEFEM